ncbi:MAG TPA: RIP metalloprotease RseP [Arenimonas sp.]|nr:RIP metalloprotease RseP [Arenimonas sp.]
MIPFLSPVVWYIITIGILVTVHEWGHFIVARLCGVHVERFSVGFGRALFKKTGKSGTEYQLSMIPLGGYVKMLDERDQEVPEAMKAFAFNRQSVGKRIAIVSAGPIANLILCILLLWLSLTLGSTELRPLLGPSQGLAQQAGFAPADEITAIDGTAVRTWSDALPMLALAAMDRRTITVGVQTADGQSATRRLPLDKLDADFDQTKLLQAVGFTPYFSNPSPVVGMVQPDGPSQGILQVGDRIIKINDSGLESFDQIPDVLAREAQAGRNLQVEIERNGLQMRFFIEPKRFEQDGKSRWRLGIGSPPATKIIQYGVLEALPVAVAKTYGMASDSLSIIRRLLTGSASVDNLSGPVSIAQAADNQASWGFSAFLSFLAAISLALCIMNLLPIPMLDGGHLLYYTFEGLTGKPVSESFQAVGQAIGMFLLISLFGIAIFNDFFRIIS